MTEPDPTPAPKLPPTSECARLFRAAYGVSPVLGASRDVNHAVFYGVEGPLTPTTDLTGKFDPATRLGMACLLVSAMNFDYTDVLTPSLHVVLTMQKEAGWSLSPQSLRYLDRLADRPDPADVPSFPTITSKGHIDPGPAVEFHRIPVSVAVRWLAHKRDRMELAKSPQSLVELALAALVRAVDVNIAFDAELGDPFVRSIARILETRAANKELDDELSGILATMLRDERAADDARFAYLVTEGGLSFGDVNQGETYEVAMQLADADAMGHPGEDDDYVEPEDHHYARAARMGIDQDIARWRAEIEKEPTS